MKIQLNPQVKGGGRNSVLELMRIFCLLAISLGHYNGGGPGLIPDDIQQWLLLAPIVLFSILTGYFYFSSPKLKFKQLENGGIKSENLIFRKMASRIIFWIILGNVATGIVRLLLNGEWGIFVDENWYIYGMLVISVVGAFVQKMYWKTKSEAPIYALIIFGIVLMLIGFYYIDFDYQFRFWRLGMMFAGLGFGWIVFQLQRKSKIVLLTLLWGLTAILILINYLNIPVSHLFPNGSKIDSKLYIFTACSALFVTASNFNFSNKFINKLSIISYFILEAHWIGVYCLESWFANKSIELQRLSYFIEIVLAMTFAYIVYLFNVVWTKYIEIHLFKAFDCVTNWIRTKNKWLNLLLQKRNMTYVKAYELKK